jgi:hypothetical protein
MLSHGVKNNNWSIKFGQKDDVLENRELRKALGPEEEVETEGPRQLHTKAILFTHTHTHTHTHPPPAAGILL